jgi:hypothetical protein
VNPGTREDTNNQRGQRVQGAQLCTQKSNPARALGLFAKSRVWGSRDKFNPGHGTHFALVRSTMPKAGKPHSGRWVAYYRVSTDRQATAALGSTRSVSSLAIISTAATGCCPLSLQRLRAASAVIDHSSPLRSRCAGSSGRS